MSEQKGKSKWLTLVKKVVVPAVTAVGIAAVDVGLLNGLLGQTVKLVLQSLQVVA
ncbi:hypothetical protein [Sphingorhabdus lacus]|uniref:hypothetical protein n=1 Tax=Sphingorhabdus lacus TaxID=392610 RepID=UPI0035932862